MQRWSPDELFSQAAAASATVDFTSLDAATVAGVDRDGFRADFPTETSTGVMERLDSQERDTLYRMATEDVRAEMAAEQERRDSERLRVQEQFLQDLADRIGANNRESFEMMSRGTAELAIAMAEQIVKQTIEIDRSVLMRALDTVMYKARNGAALVVTTNPADAEYLKSHTEAVERLNISTVRSDPRVAQGGCLVESEGQEWDLTIESRIETLAEAVRESMAGGGGGDDGTPLG